MAFIFKKIYLISKWGDPIFALSIGCLSYFLYERNHPRPSGNSLMVLLKKRVYSQFSHHEEDLSKFIKKDV
ncbi:hypothetical protein PNEG_03516 [Pneumocystis murina B123]|uniref:Uncharacterized protein n=1 Tax=Pneumocystis murina (strain B123) TaxID=1069680 RepID=M7NLR0_PNEMU|nr:hypothetical protein PNEG_03516 [Pneumocystis murina B123]EMR08076.1 hypothetical protein PNEG_03516 [Pneumocystis murina B123]